MILLLGIIAILVCEYVWFDKAFQARHISSYSVAIVADPKPYGSYNCFGHTRQVSINLGIFLLIAFYCARYAIYRLFWNEKTCMILLYFLLVGMTLPLIWLFVVTEWDNPQWTPVARWYGYPIGLLVIPTAFFRYDLNKETRDDLGILGRSLIEVVVLVPIWFVCWIVLQLALGLLWI